MVQCCLRAALKLQKVTQSTQVNPKTIAKKVLDAQVNKTPLNTSVKQCMTCRGQVTQDSLEILMYISCSCLRDGGCCCVKKKKKKGLQSLQVTKFKEVTKYSLLLLTETEKTED